MAKESVLSMADKEAIVIEKLIFHIIITDEVIPTYLDEIEITEEQKKFFKDRLSDAAQGRQYIFTPDNPHIKRLGREILKADNDKFVELSKEITESFHQAHRGNTNNGVFIVSIASIRKRQLLFLIKLDHKKVYEYKLKGAKALLEEVKNTFIEDKSAIQKVALIDINSNVVWDVLVYDRSKSGGITDFFAKFLSVLPRETESDLTRKFQNMAREWASNNIDIRDTKQEPSMYKNRARNYLVNTDLVDSDNYINAVIIDDNDSRRKKSKESFKKFLEEKGMYGQEFTPKREALTPKEQKNIRQTAEGVKIEWMGEAKDNNITISQTPDQNGEYTIVVKTSQIKDIQ
ncbi:nucleoid-associated protein [Porphyromonas pogonae]|uniref:nucleoid-associated protein n=1 Tax=Porphyromonas pogonae TaxID=867595 RepID=UPI002E79E5FF|nr:nucleoid-associated protein [Porphyromonas pogonae]